MNRSALNFAFAQNVPFGSFSLGTFCPSQVSYTHDVTTYTSCATMQMHAHLHNQETNLDSFVMLPLTYQ